MTSTRIVAILRWLGAATILSSVVWQVTDRLAHNLFRPAEYFSYFSIQGTMIAAVMLAYTGWLSWSGTLEKKQVTIARISATTYSIVTALVYNLLLRNVPGEPGYVWPVWPNEVLHVWAPILLVLDWLFAPGRASIRLRASLWVLIYPVAWVAFSIIRGLATGWWPYPFLNPTEPAGWAGVVEYIVGIAVFFLLSAFVFVAIARIWERARASRD